MALVTINGRCIDTDYPEECIEEIESLLPYGLGRKVAAIIEETPNTIEELESQVSSAENQMDEMRDCRDKAQTLIDNLIDSDLENASVKDIIEALKYIRDELDDM